MSVTTTESNTAKFHYVERDVTPMPNKELGNGKGLLRGYTSLTLGLLSLLAVLAYSFPTYLTTAELRAAYDGEMFRTALKYGMYGSLFFAFATFVSGKRRRMGLAGIIFTGVAFLLGGYNVPTGEIETKPLSLGVDWLILSFLLSTIVFTSLEKILPKYRDQVVLRKEWKLDMLYFGVNHLLISAIILVGNWAVSVCDFAINDGLQASVQALPIWVQFIIVLLIADFVLYWEHRAFHELPKLWGFHAVHHSVETMDWLAGSRSHVVSTFIERTLVIVPLYLLGPDKLALDMYVAFAALQAVYIHCNTSFNLGPLKHILVTAQFHHWHHSSEEPAIDTNYAAHTQIWDRLFGTFHLPDEHWPAVYGTTERLPRTFEAQLKYPFQQL
ncbi:sterol desaturase family protein [Arenicella sp. 4NH20-0111]|uniref:sterol desaturase family protein n=1 Tax=Arenicella sp. 4NH20-0111 TaxID=3127648 RepID=UPI00310A8F52